MMALLLSVAMLAVCGASVWAAEPLPQPTGRVILTISGRIEQSNAPGEARFDRGMLESLGEDSIRTSSVWFDDLRLFEGVPLEAVLDRVGAHGRTMTATALNAYQIDIPFEDLKFSPLLALRMDGAVLTIRDKGPIWIVYPRDHDKDLQSETYDARWVWQLKSLHVE